MVPSYGPFETIQLLSEKFFSPGLDFRDIRLDGLKWSALYKRKIIKNLSKKFIKIKHYVKCIKSFKSVYALSNKKLTA